MTDSLARLHEAHGYCIARSPEAGVMCQRMADHDPLWHAHAGTRPGEERVWLDESPADVESQDGKA